LLILLLAAGPARAAYAQDTRTDPVRAAVQLRNTGDLAGAARLLQNRLAEAPGDPQAIRLLAQTLYWLKQVDRARSVYDTAVSRHPDNLDIRLEYARMLVETRHDEDARRLLGPLADASETAGRAHVLLGTLDYWEGRLTGAANHFRTALRADSSLSEARRQWREIAEITAPWIRIAGEAAHDDQPATRISPTLDLGVFLTPLWSLEGSAGNNWYRSGDSLSRTVQTGELTLKGYTPGLALETVFSGGVFHRSFGAANNDWTATAEGRFRLPGHFTIGGRASRKPYFYTTASLTTPVLVREVIGLASLNAPAGWLGEAGVGRQTYPDGNTVTSGYAWLLAPIAKGPQGSFSLGYAFSAENARESRFVLADPSQTAQPGSAGFNLAGRYVPYYTPDHVVAHSAIGNITLHPGHGVTISGNGAWAISAHERAHSFVVSGAPPTLQVSTARQTFTPWTARLVAAQDVASGWSIRAQIEHDRSAFYEVTTAGVTLVYRFAAAAARRVDRF
ncbi:MAG TPA: tetratricopeptide repeat protein, partial [Gemmatimonadales bacterium]|nr:tetratricopeptide repeat protein [Gemmatimonadales bacterium]